MQVTAIDEFDKLMREWVSWIHELQGLGYSDSTPVWRAQFGNAEGQFLSAPPKGVEKLKTHGALRRLVAAMEDLSRDEETLPMVSCVQWAYLFGTENACRMYTEGFNKSRATFYSMLKTGELLLKRESRRH